MTTVLAFMLGIFIGREMVVQRFRRQLTEQIDRQNAARASKSRYRAVIIPGNWHTVEDVKPLDN